MIYTHLIAALLSAAMAFAGAWQIQSLRTKANEKEHIERHAAQERDLHVLEQKRSRHALDAVNLSRASETRLRAESARNRDALVGLRASSADALSFARTSLDACLVATTTLSELHIAGATEYSELAEKAQRHVIDLQTLNAAWPK